MMLSDFPLFPEQASTVAGHVDLLFIFLCVLTGGVSLLVFIVIFFLAIKFRRTPENEIAQDYEIGVNRVCQKLLSEGLAERWGAASSVLVLRKLADLPGDFRDRF